MPSRWIRWEPSTHIYEYSTDFAASWNPLPLNAAILTEGVIDAARLPPTIPKLDTTNTFTGAPAIVISNPAASLRFTETDAPTDAKNWELQADGQIFRIRRANDAWSSFTDMILLHRAGVFQVFTDIATADHSFQCSANAKIGLNIRANNAGNLAYSQLGLGNDVSVFATVIQMFSSTYNGSSEPDFPASLSIKSGGVNGVSFVTTGGIRFYTAGSLTRRLEITTAGDAKFSGAIHEYGRGFPQGRWYGHAAVYSCAGGGTWTVEGGDVVTYQYCVIGKTMFVNFYIGSTTVAGVVTELRFDIPAGFTASAYFENQIRILTNSVRKQATAFIETGSNIIKIVQNDLANWTAGTNTTYVIGQLAFSIN